MKINTSMITRIALGTAFIAVGAQLAIPVNPPVTMQTFCIFIIALVLKPLESFLTLFIYSLLGIVGVPVFASFSGGLDTLLGLRGGYILSFPIIAPLTSYLLRRFRMSLFTHAFTFTLATLICYIMGIAWIKLMGYYDGSIGKLLQIFVVPFLIFDPFKIAIASICTVKLGRILKNGNRKN